MANSINEMKEALNIKTVRSEWNDLFPKDELLAINKENRVMSRKIKKFYEKLDRHNLSVCRVNRRDLCNIGQIADECDLILAYIVSEPIAIELFFWDKMETTDWLAQFKPHCTRRQFFSMVQTLKNIKPASSEFTLSQYYQLISPNVPIGYTATATKLDNDHIIVAYRHDVAKPIFRVIEIAEDGFKSFVPEIRVDLDLFDSIELSFNGKTYRGDSIKTLWDGNEHGHNDADTISAEFNGKTHILNTATGTIEFSYEEFFEIEKFRRGKNIEIILEVNRHNKKALLLSNGFVWILHNDTFYDIRSFSGLEQINLDFFAMSSQRKGIVFSRDLNSIELVPCAIFSDLIYRLL
jgi:hypothetical protein